MAKKKCRPTKYSVVRGDRIISCFKCARHNIPSRHYSTPEIRDEAIREHRRVARKSS